MSSSETPMPTKTEVVAQSEEIEISTEPASKKQKTSSDSSDYVPLPPNQGYVTKKNNRATDRANRNSLDVTSEYGILITCQNTFTLKAGIPDFVKHLRRACPAKLSPEEKEECKRRAMEKYEKSLKEKETDESELKPANEILEEILSKEIYNKTDTHYTLLQHKDVPQGCAFMKVAKVSENGNHYTPTEVAETMLQNFLDRKEHSNSLGRILPCQYLCKPNKEGIERVIKGEVKKMILKKIEEMKSASDTSDKNTNTDVKFTWSLQHKLRSMKQNYKGPDVLSKEVCLSIVDQMIGEVIKETEAMPNSNITIGVSMENPTYVLNIEVNPLFCGVSLLENWQKYMKYNVQSLQNPAKAMEEKKRHQKPKEGESEEKKKEEKKGEVVVEKKEEVTVVEKKLVETEGEKKITKEANSNSPTNEESSTKDITVMIEEKKVNDNVPQVEEKKVEA